MNAEIIKLLAHTKNFKDIKDITEIDPTTFILKEEDTSYSLNISTGKYYVTENFIESRDILSSMGSLEDEIVETGFIDSLDTSYMVSKNADEVSLRAYLEANSPADDYRLGMKFGKILKSYHSLEPKINIDWYKKITTRINYVLYMHGITNTIGDEDYILIDYINDNKHLAKTVDETYMYTRLAMDNVYVDKNKNLRLDKLNLDHIGDGVFDFTHINQIAVNYPDFAKGSVDGYFDKGRAPIRFYRLLSLYQAFVILESTVAIRGDRESILSAEEIASIKQMYDNFNNEVPSWT